MWMVTPSARYPCCHRGTHADMSSLHCHGPDARHARHQKPHPAVLGDEVMGVEAQEGKRTEPSSQEGETPPHLPSLWAHGRKMPAAIRRRRSHAPPLPASQSWACKGTELWDKPPAYTTQSMGLWYGSPQWPRHSQSNCPSSIFWKEYLFSVKLPVSMSKIKPIFIWSISGLSFCLI